MTVRSHASHAEPTTGSTTAHRGSLLLLVAATGLLGLVPLQADEPLIKGWTYTCAAQPLGDQWADPQFTKLNDGNKDAGKSAILGGGTITVDITLPAPTRLRRLVASVFRHNDNYKLSKLVVAALQAGQYVPVGENTNGFWGPTKERAFALAVPLDVTTDRLRVSFVTASIVSIQEIELFGEPAPPAATGGYRLPVDDSPGAHVREVDADGDGKPEVVLENPLVRLILQPDGGVCRSMLLKPSASELVGGTGRYGMLRDQLWSPQYSFGERFYFVTTGTGPEGAWVELKAQGVGGMLSFTEVSKRIVLGPTSPVVRVHYSLKNDPNSQTDYSYGLWVHNFLGVQGYNATYFFPTTAGVVEQRFEGGKPLEVWHYDPARGWSAYVADSGVGLAAVGDYRLLNCFYMWAGTGTPIPTFEWRYNRLLLAAGKSLETDVTLIPLQGLPRVDGVVGEVAGSIVKETAPAGGVRIHLYRPPGSLPVRVTVQARPLPAGPWADLATRDMPATDLELGVDTSALRAPACVVRCSLQRDEQELGWFERPLSWQDTKLAYELKPLEQRIGESGPADVKQQAGHELATTVATPHVKWAKPYCKGPLKALVLCDDRYSREVIELWQRLDIEFQYVKFFTTLDKEWLYHGDRSIVTLDAAQKRLTEKLKQDYDVIILSGLKWDHHFTPELRRTIADKVEAGTGLVYIEPDGLTPDDELGGACGIPDGEHRSLSWYGRWAPSGEHYLTSGLPWDTFPRTRRMPLVKPPAGEVLATIAAREQQPLLVAGRLGKGRVLTLTYDTLTHAPSYRGYAALTPAVSYRGKWCLPDEMAKVTWSFWEQWWALLARCAVWAAGKDSGMRFEALAPTADTRSLQGRIVGPVPADARLEVTFRDRFSAPVGEARAALTREGEGTALQVAVPDTVRAGKCFADLILRDAAGAAIAWGVAAFDVGGLPALKQVTVEKRTVTATEALWTADQPWKQVFRSREPLRLTCEVAPVLPLTEALSVTARLSDCHDRLLFEETRPVVADTPTVTFAASPPVLYNIGQRWDVTL